MKKIFIFAATAALLASCAQDELINEVDPSNVEQAIGFATTSNLITRAENSTATNKSALENYNQSFYVWGNKNVTEGSQQDPSVFFKQEVDFDGEVGTGSWGYEPERYWDKSANYYRFYAVSPAIAGWSIAYSDATGGTGITTMDGVTDMKFAFTGYVADGLSLAQKATGSSTVPSNSSTDPNYDSGATTQTADVFSENKDLMISEDIKNWTKVDGTEKVNLDFIHILSRLNIAVKTDLVAHAEAEKVTLADGSTVVEVYKDALDNMYMKDGDEYYQLTINADDDTKYDKADVAYTGEDVPVITFDQTNSYNIVKLTSVNVVKMNNNGDFNEMGFDTDGNVNPTAIDATTLKNGTDSRWIALEPNTTGFGVSFANHDDATTFTNTPDAATDGEYVATVTSTADFTNVLNDKYVFFYQGLVVPQTIKYAAMDIKGTDAASADQPYLKISYTIDGEPFTYYYNLAGTFQNVYDEYKVNNRVVYKTSEPNTTTYLYMDTETNKCYTTSNGSTEATIITKEGETYKNGVNQVWLIGGAFYDADTSGNEIENAYVLGNVVTRAEATTLFSDDTDNIASCSTTFCEGWQNNLYINITPKKIQFTADVYKWVTKVDSPEFPIE